MLDGKKNGLINIEFFKIKGRHHNSTQRNREGDSYIRSGILDNMNGLDRRLNTCLHKKAQAQVWQILNYTMNILETNQTIKKKSGANLKKWRFNHDQCSASMNLFHLQNMNFLKDPGMASNSCVLCNDVVETIQHPFFATDTKDGNAQWPAATKPWEMIFGEYKSIPKFPWWHDPCFTASVSSISGGAIEWKQSFNIRLNA